MPAFMINPTDGIFLADLFGFLISLPVSLFLAFWISAVRSRGAVISGAFAGALLGFLIILGWVGTLIYNTPLPGADPAPTFFGSLLLCSALGLVCAMLADLALGRANSRDYRRRVSSAPEHVE